MGFISVFLHANNRNTIGYDTIDDLHWKTGQFNLAHKLTKTRNVLNGIKKVKTKHQETDGYGRNKRPEREKIKGRK